MVASRLWVATCLVMQRCNVGAVGSHDQAVRHSLYHGFEVSLLLPADAPRFLCSDTLTEADVRLFPPIFRFDNVYHLRFRLNEALISESYPNLQRWMEEVWAHIPLPQGRSRLQSRLLCEAPHGWLAALLHASTVWLCDGRYEIRDLARHKGQQVIC